MIEFSSKSAKETIALGEKLAKSLTAERLWLLRRSRNGQDNSYQRYCKGHGAHL